MKSIYKNGMGEVTEKKSRFIAHVFNVTSEEKAVEHINTVKKEYWDARHNCYAYVVGEKNELQRFSDDGEPSGTAGKPILEIITQSKIQNCLIVVTRYFGGTLLGTGGLIRAYQAASKAGIAAAQVIESVNGILAELDTEYANLAKIQHICAEMEVDIISILYTNNVHISFIVHEEGYVHFVQKLTNVFSGKLTVVRNGQQKYAKTAKNEIILL
jgi:uncharacterized YigZ family protein